MSEVLDEAVHWYVIFQPRTKPRARLIHFFIWDVFAHCCMVREAGNKSVLVNPCAWGLNVRVLDVPAQDLILSEAPKATAVLSFVADYRFVSDYRFRGLYTCVTALKSVLGFKKGRLIQTPFALYKHLLRYDTCTVIKPYIPYVRGK